MFKRQRIRFQITRTMLPRRPKRPLFRHHSSWIAAWRIISLLLLITNHHSSSADEIIPATRSRLKGAWEKCSSHHLCDDCYAASHVCHWCPHDNACHAKGSVHGGCVSGASCGTGTATTTAAATTLVTVTPDGEDADDSQNSWSAKWETCSSHESCDDCYAASHTCHWCAHDNACHAKGSLHGGCVTGASCGATTTTATSATVITTTKVTGAATAATAGADTTIATTAATAAATTAATTAAATDATPSVDPSKNSSWTSWETCSSHQSCDDCYAASHTCHWCAHDNACHVKGSIHTGCVTGASCGDAPPTPDSKTCADHTSCGDCTASSWGCHWCSSDEACHAVGSMHGCAAGANCYSIDRCQRLEPEKIDYGGTFSSSSFHGVGPLAKGLLITMLSLVLCCSTLCFAGVTFVKCAVDDLVGEPAEIVEDGMLIGGGGEEEQGYEGVQQEEEAGPSEELEIPLMQNDGTEQNNDAELARPDSGYIGEVTAATPDGKSSDANLNSLLRSAGDAASVARSRISLSSNRATPRGSSIKRMYCACQSCYLFTLLSAILLFVVGMSYAPREPQYNVCTNELAWKSIVEGMASLKMSASFDLLISVYNPNRFEVDLSDGSGQFHHDGEYVGSFDIPEGKISEKAISDIVVKVTFTPDKWSALSLTSEYYRGNLKFVVGGHAHVKIPALGNYNFDAKFEDIHVNVNDPSLDDTHLCACPGWKRPLDGWKKPAWAEVAP